MRWQNLGKIIPPARAVWKFVFFCMIEWPNRGLGSELEYSEEKQFWEISTIVPKIRRWKWECKPETSRDESFVY